LEPKRSDFPWIDRAATEALKATGTYKLGAVVVSGNRLLATGFNRKRNDPRFCERGWSIHAEVSALKRIKQGALRPNTTIYVARVTRAGRIAMAKPCETCEKAVYDSGIKRIIYTTNEGAHLAVAG
jgi:tRNA(Arg) A34 adenosine deaminase TadA